MFKQMLLTIALTLSLLPIRVYAYVVQIDTGVHTTVPRLLAGFVNVILVWGGVIATGLFLLGAILMIGSGGNDQYLSAGKRIMKSALIGYVILLSSWMILSTVVYFIAA